MIKTSIEVAERERAFDFSALDRLAPSKYDYEATLKKFVENAQKNGLNVIVAENVEQAKESLSLVVRGAEKIYVHDYLEAWYLRLAESIDSIQPQKANLKDLDLAIVPGSIGVSDSGSIIFYADYLEEALITVPKKLVILLGIERIIPSIVSNTKYIAVIWRKLFGGTRSLSIFSAPSRTGDIEKKVVLGAHGPKEVDIVIMSWYSNLLDKLGKFVLPHYRLVPLAFSEEKSVRRLGGSLGILDIAIYSSLGGNVKTFLGSVLNFYRRFGIDVSSIFGEYI